MNTKELIDRIFKEPGVKFELTEFENLGKPIHDIINIYPKAAATGKDAGKTKYYLKSFIPFSTGNEEVQVYAEGGKSAPEEIVRQLWVYKLMHQYGYQADEIDLEKGVQFGTEIGTKAADIIVYTDATKLTPKIIVECKKPKRKDGIEQLKSYMNAKGAPVAVWSNGADSIILYRPYPAQFDDTLFDIPKRGQAPKDVLEASKTLLQLKKDFNFKKIIQDLEELVLADSGKDEFNEIFKLIFAKIWDEKEALENRANKVVEFRKAIDPEITYDRINNLFHKACEEWPGIFKEGEDIESYIRRAGGYTQGADEARVLVVRQDGSIVEALPSARTVLRAGDELMVLPKVETKNIEVTRGITQIIYQIAVAARIALGL